MILLLLPPKGVIFCSISVMIMRPPFFKPKERNFFYQCGAKVCKNEIMRPSCYAAQVGLSILFLVSLCDDAPLRLALLHMDGLIVVVCCC